jgi:molybdenum cofactor cytidylyltransferase
MALKTIMDMSSIPYVFVIVNKEDKLEWIANDIKLLLKGKKGEIIVCEDAWKGQSYSLKSGILKAIEHSVEKVMICLADQPFISNDMLKKLQNIEIDEYEDYIASVHQGVIKPPIIFSARAFPKLLKVEGDVGARKLLEKNFLKGKKIEFSEDNLFLDIDTKDDYKKILDMSLF